MPSATRVFLTVFFDLIGFGIVLPLLPSYGARFTASAALIGALVATDSLLTFLLAPRWGRLSDRIGRRPVLLIGLAGSAVSYLVFGLAGSFAMLLLSRVISGATGATVHVAQAYLADITPPERRSHAMGLIGAAFGLGFTIGPAIGGSAPPCLVRIDAMRAHEYWRYGPVLPSKRSESSRSKITFAYGTTIAFVMFSARTVASHSAGSKAGSVTTRRPANRLLSTFETPAMWYGGTLISAASSVSALPNSTVPKT